MLALARRLALLTAVSIYNTWWLRLLNVTFSFKRSEWGLARRARPDVLPFLSFSDRLRLFYSLWSHCFLVFYFLAATASLDTNRTAPIVYRPNRMVSTAGSPAKAGSDTVHYIRNSSFVSRLSLSPPFTQRKSLEWRYLSRCNCKYRCSCGPPPSDMAVQGSIAEGDGNGSPLLRRFVVLVEALPPQHSHIECCWSRPAIQPAICAVSATEALLPFSNALHSLSHCSDSLLLSLLVPSSTPSFCCTYEYSTILLQMRSTSVWREQALWGVGSHSRF